QDYVNSLEDLTLNSRPIIKNLTVIAGENQQAASVVAEVVCSRLHSAPPRYKVPVLFLIDSICKNVGHAYIPEFAKRIVPAFTSAYNKISPDDRHNFRRVLAIWKENKPRPLFPVSVIAALDKHIHQTAGQRHPQPQSQPPHQQPPYAQYTTHSAKPGYYPCKQCGARYPETSIGKKQLDKHLDWHFRSNSRFKDKVRQAQPRGWFVSEKDWIDSRQTDNEDLTPAKIFEQATAGHDEADGEAGDHEHSDDALLRAMVITVPSEPHSSICPVCNEKLTGVWSEDEEDWVYRNAVLVEGDSIYHATC
ncbi:hypothetical protein BJ085DRAFT_6817, partial [Dimargaris cristalligena]